MPETVPLLVVCVLNWNRPDDTISCVASVLASHGPHPHVLVVDNGSDDDSVVRLWASFGDAIEILETGMNRYFAGGMNAGIEHALGLGAEMVLILNNDTIAAPDAISRLLDAAANHPEAGILAPAICYATDPVRIWSLGSRRLRWRPFPYEVARHTSDRGELSTPFAVDVVTGCAMLIRRCVIERIGLFDVRYRHYFEDADFCLRAEQAGFSLLVEPRARIYHAVAQSATGEPSTVQYLKVRGRARFYRSYRFGAVPILTHLGVWAQESTRAVALLLGGDSTGASAIWRGLIDGYREPLERYPIEAAMRVLVLPSR